MSTTKDITLKYSNKIRKIHITKENMEDVKKGKYVTISRFYNEIDTRAPENVLSLVKLKDKMYLSYWGNSHCKMSEYNEDIQNYVLDEFKNPKSLLFNIENKEN